MRLAWEILNGLEAYRITQIPRRPSSVRQPAGDPGRAQRVAALAAAYQAGADQAAGAEAVVIGWLRPGDDDPVQLLAAGAGLVGSRREREALLTLPGGARARPLPGGALAGSMSVLPCWRAIGGISDGLLASGERRGGAAAPSPPAPSLEECLLAVWPGAFGWLLVAEPVGGAEARGLADAVARQRAGLAGGAEREAAARSEAGPADGAERELAARRLALRHAELRRGMSTGLWRVRLLAGGSDRDAASRVAVLACASVGLAGLPYAIAPVPGPAVSLRELLEDPATATPGGDALLGSPLVASTELVAALARPPEREIPGVLLVSGPDFDVTQEPPGARGSGAQGSGTERQAITVGEVLDRGHRPAGRLVLPLDSLNRHVFVCGATGSGKSHTIRALLAAAAGAGIPWLVLEPAKAEYRLMAERLAAGPATGPATGPRLAQRPARWCGSGRANRTRSRPGSTRSSPRPTPRAAGSRCKPTRTWSRRCSSRRSARASRPAQPAPQVLGAALRRAYEEAGWDLALGEPVVADSSPRYPDLTDLQRAAEQAVREAGYGQRGADDVPGFIGARLAGLRLGTIGRFVEGGHRLDFGRLLQTNIVLEMQDVGDDGDKAFGMGIVLVRLAEQLRMADRAKATGPSRPAGCATSPSSSRPTCCSAAGTRRGCSPGCSPRSAATARVSSSPSRYRTASARTSSRTPR